MQDPSTGDQLTTERKFDELIAEYHRKTDRGEPVDPAAFIAANPDFRDQLKQYFADLEVVEKMAGPTTSVDTSVADATVINGLVAAGESDQQPESSEPAIDDSGTQAGAYAGASVTTASTGEVPEQFGRYRILKELGRGAMGAVYLAEDEQLQRKVALKVPKFPDGMNSELLERFYREARAAGNLRHPGICPVYDVGDIDDQHFITMAYIEGRPLKNLTESDRPQDVTTVAGIVQKIAEAMAVAHKQGVIHRDLKPANVMLDTEDQPVVMDFGLARRSVDNEEKLTQTGMVLGSPAYMSPEQVDSDNDKVGPPADIYTLGVIFYELLTGGLPFQGGLMSILRQISMDQPRPVVELRGDVDPVIEELCLKMLAKDAEDRPESMQAVAQQLSDWLEGRRVLRGEAATLAIPGTVASRPASEKVRRSDGQRVTAHERQSSPDSVDAGRKRKLLLAAGLGGVLLLAASLTFFVRLGKHDVKITLSDPSIRLSVDEEVISIVNGEETVRLSAGPHQLQLQAGNLSAMVDSFVVSKDGKTALQVVLAEGRFDVFSNGRKISQDPLDPDNSQKLARTDTAAPPPSMTDRDRAAAEWVISNGGMIETDAGLYETVEKLPMAVFRITAIRFPAESESVTAGTLQRIAGLSQLRELRVGAASIVDADLPHLQSFPSLERLAMGGKNQRFSDAGLAHLKPLTKLNWLSLGGTPVSNEGLAHLKGLTNLQFLFISATRIGDAGLVHLKGLTKLEALHLQQNKLTGVGLEHLKTLTSLKSIKLFRTQIDDAALIHLGEMKLLQEVFLNGTRVTPEGVAELQNALPDCRIEWDGNS